MPPRCSQAAGSPLARPPRSPRRPPLPRAGIPLDSGIRVLDDNYKVDKYIKIAMLYLQDDESVNAETYINRASLLINDDTDGALKLQHKARAPARGPGARHIARAPSARRAAGVLRADPRLEAEIP